MKKKSVLILGLILLLLAFFAALISTDSNDIQGNYVYSKSNIHGVSCTEDLEVFNGDYLVPCNNGILDWKSKISLK